MSPVSAHLSADQFARDTRRALYQLYDYGELIKNPLFKALGLDGRANPMFFSDKLIEVIASLKPDPSAAPDSDAWRTYRILTHRFIDQFNQEEVSASLGLSIRQLRRHESQAIRAFASALARRFGLGLSEKDFSSLPVEEIDSAAPLLAATPLETPTLVHPNQQELTWLEQSAPSAVVSLSELVDTCLRTVQPLANSLQVALARHLPDDLPRSMARGDLLLQALLLLLTDLLKSGWARAIEIGVEARAGRLEICLAGEPLPGLPQALPELANYRLASQLAGLAGAQVEQASSDTCALFIRLPVIAALTVLFIDDNADTLQLYRRYLTDTRFQYAGQRDPVEALAAIAEIRPDIILQDIMLPNLDGWELLGRLRTHPQIQSLPVIVCSILPQKELALTLGASAFLQKPLSREVLLQSLDQQAATLGKGAH